VEQVIEALEQVKAQKAALENQEKRLADLLKKKLDAQGERVKKLGLPRGEPKPDVTPRTDSLKTASDGVPATIPVTPKEDTSPLPRR